MLAESPAIVLKAVDFSESSKIITLFSKSHGKVAVMARGIRKSKSRLAGTLHYGAVVDAQFYMKESRGVQTLKDADTRISTAHIQGDFPRLAVSMAFLELIGQVVQEGEPNDDLYSFTESFLNWLNHTTGSPRTLFPYLQMRTAAVLGVGIQFDESAERTLPYYLNVNSGSISAEADDGLSFRLSEVQLNYTRLALRGKSSGIPGFDIETQELKKLIYHLDVYLKHHIDGIRDRKSDAIFDQIL